MLGHEHNWANQLATDLAGAWVNGNRAEVIRELKVLRPNLKCALVALLLCDRLEPHDQQVFANRLNSELTR